jgi:prepilin-type N-terminal cleavage/methylation domain-containing protein
MKRDHNIRINQDGFTMIEMVVVLIVMAIIATIIAYRPVSDTNSLISQTDMLKSHLRYAQIRAMNDVSPNTWGIHIEDSTHYVLYKNNAQPTDIILPGEAPNALPNAQTHTLNGGVVFTSGVGTTINFDELGSPGTSTLTISLSRGSEISPITVIKNTGYIQ